MESNWIKIKNKYPNNCIQCGLYIEVGDEVLWMQGLGIKHEECPTGIEEDNSTLVIMDDEAQKMMGNW